MIDNISEKTIIDSITKAKQCCRNTPTKLIFYDAGRKEIQAMLVCEEHHAQKPFTRFAITLEDGKNFVDVSKIFIKKSS